MTQKSMYLTPCHLLRGLVFALVSMVTTGCATVSFQSSNLAIVSGKWKAVGPEFQDYVFDVVVENQEPRLRGKPEVRFKDENARAKYQKKYGEMDRTVQAFASAVDSLGALANLGGPTRTTVEVVNQHWDSSKGELIWTESTYEVVGGKRDQTPMYSDEYRIRFESAQAGTMYFDNKEFDLERFRVNRP
jgi:hypothetical protein